MSASEIAALVSARLCHDLISPIGAIGNGLELLRMAEGRDSEPELALISDSLGMALAKLRFYRIAFGPADIKARQSFDEARQITNAMFTGRFGVTWLEGEGGTMSRSVAQIAYLAILCFERSMPMGGDLRVLVEADRIALEADGCRVAAPAELWLHVTCGAPLSESRAENVQFPLLRRAMLSQSFRADRSFTANSAQLSLTGPALSEAIPA